MSDNLDAILRRVAQGEITPEEALPLIDAARPSATPEWGTPSSAPPGEPGAPETPAFGGPSAEGAPRAVRIAVSYRSVDVIADPTVDQVAVTGSHSVRRENGLLIVESLQMPGFSEEETVRSSHSGPWAFMALPRSVAWARAMKGGHITIRINPSLPVEIDSAAAAIRLNGCSAGAKIRIVAASVKLERVGGPLDVEAITSAVKGTAAVTGTSRIVCESSSVKLSLLAGSNLRASLAGNRMGKVVLPGPEGGPDYVVGSGEGTLTVESTMSSVVLNDDFASARKRG
jgi:hypothetical protein